MNNYNFTTLKKVFYFVPRIKKEIEVCNADLFKFGIYFY